MHKQPLIAAALAVLCAGLVLVVSAFSGCTAMSESVTDPSIGTNGGFEHASSGIPTNWIAYTPATIPSGDYDLLFDDADYKEGRQSLRFLVRDCAATGGWHSPGICQEYPARAGDSYKIRFWIKNDGCTYTVRVGAVDAWTGQFQAVDTSSASSASDGAWRRVEHVFVMPQAYDRIRFELSITSPGSLWIDDVRIDRDPGRRVAADAAPRG